MKGLFIVFEGQDGAGKTTQIEALRDHLAACGREVVLTREPGGTLVAEKIRKILLDRENAGMDAACEAYLYAAARAEHVHRVIAPALARGAVVLCDRFLLSSIAYQGYGRRLGAETIVKLNELAMGDVKPDCTFYLFSRSGARTVANRKKQDAGPHRNGKSGLSRARERRIFGRRVE